MFRLLAGWLSKKDDGMEAVVKAAVADDQACAILRLVLENPGISGEKLAGRAGLEPEVFRQYLNRLTEDCLVEEDAGTGYSVAESARPAVIKYLPLHYQCPGLLR